MAARAKLWHVEPLSDGRVIQVLRMKAHVDVVPTPRRIEVPLDISARKRTSLTRAEKGELNRLLNRWGNWIEKHADFQGYSRLNILESYIGSDPVAPGHKILCLEMPHDVYCTHQRIIKLPEVERSAIELFYIPRMKPDGTVWSLHEKCIAMNIDEKEIRIRLKKGRLKIVGIEVSECYDD